MTFYHSFQQQSIAIDSLMKTTGSLSIEIYSLMSVALAYHPWEIIAP